MALKHEYASRAHWAFWKLQQEAYPEEFTQSDLGARVARRVKRATAYTQTAVAGWLSGALPREFETMVALARELGLDEIWLYFSRGEAPAGWKEERHRFPASQTPERKVGAGGRKARRASGE